MCLCVNWRFAYTYMHNTWVCQRLSHLIIYCVVTTEIDFIHPIVHCHHHHHHHLVPSHFIVSIISYIFFSVELSFHNKQQSTSHCQPLPPLRRRRQFIQRLCPMTCTHLYHTKKRTAVYLAFRFFFIRICHAENAHGVTTFGVFFLVLVYLYTNKQTCIRT